VKRLQRSRVFSFVVAGLLAAGVGVSLLMLGDAAWLWLGLVGALLLRLVTLCLCGSARTWWPPPAVPSTVWDNGVGVDDDG
jgi:hypothetical protein